MSNCLPPECKNFHVIFVYVLLYNQLTDDMVDVVCVEFLIVSPALGLISFFRVAMCSYISGIASV